MSFLKHKMEQHITETADGEYRFGREDVFTETTSDRVVKKENGDKYVDIGLHGEKPYGIHELQHAVTQNPFLGCDYHIERGEEIAFAKNLNKYVDVDDHFIFLGDFDSRHSTPEFDRIKRFFANIKCRNVYLILGNNDSFPVKKYKELGIKAIVDKFEFGNCILTHFPVMVKAPMINIHGHLHGAASPTQKGEKAYWYADPKRCVDVWRDDFSPVRLNDVLSNWKEMQKYKSYNDGKMRLLSEEENKKDITQQLKTYQESGDDVFEESLETFLTTNPFEKEITLYHGSSGKYDMIKPLRINVGTRLSNPRNSSFWGTDYEWCKIYALQKLLSENGCDSLLNTVMKSICPKDDVDDDLIAKESDKNKIDKILRSEQIYLYTKKMPKKYLGIGHNASYPEFSIDFPVKPDNVEVLGYKDFADVSIKYVTDDVYENKYVAMIKEVVAKNKKFGHGKWLKYTDEQRIKIRDELKSYKESVDEKQFEFIDFKNPKAKTYLEEGEKSYWNKFGEWHIKNSIGEIVIDKENDKLAGYIFVDNKASGQEGFITPLMVIKRYRKNGLGNRLLEDAISKYHAIDLVVKKSNDIAINMYKKHGFVTIGKGNEKDTIYMKLKSKLGENDQIIEVSSDEVLTGEVVTEEANYNKRNMYPVYIILTDADSPMAKLIKQYTGQPYAHALISFNTDLEPAYSFGCTSIKPLKFGFISKSEEDPFRNEEKAAYVVYVMYVNKMQYTKIQNKLKWFMDNKDKMKYSWGGLVTLGLHIPKQFENQYFCSQFVMDLIGDAIKLSKDPSLWTPGDIEHLENISLVDKGPDLRYFDKKRFKRNLKYIQKHQFNKMKYESVSGKPDTIIFDFGSVLVKDTSLDAFYKVHLPQAKAKMLVKKYFDYIRKDEDLPLNDAIERYRKTLPKNLKIYAKSAFITCATSVERYDYTIPLLKFLKSRGYKLYYLSNWGRSAFTLMKKSHIMDFMSLFDGGIVSYEVGLKKPNPNIYKLLINECNLDPERCIFYDDKKENCDAARRIGIKAVQFKEQTVKDIMELPSVISESTGLFSEATDSITNPNLSHYFVEKVGKRVDKVLSDPAKVKEFNTLVRNYINRNITKLTKSGPCDMIPFTDLDHKQFQEMFGFWYNITKTKETSPNEIREYIAEYSKLAHAKITFWLNNSSQVLFYFVIRYFTMHPDPKSLNAALSIYTLCIYPVMFHKYFPLGVMEPIMQYTIDNLTEKFLIKKSKHLFDSLLQSIQASYRFHKNNFKNASDKNVADWISRIRNDQNSMLKKISNEYMKNWKDGKAVRTTNEEYDSDTPIIDELENGTTAVQNIVQKVTLPIIEEGVDLVRAEAAAKMAQVSISDCRYFLTLIITDSNADLIQKFIESILFLYIYEGKKTERDIRSTYFITWAASLFKKTNSKNPNINTINDILNTWSENSGINKKFSRIASRINYKKAIFYYLILCIQKHV